MANGVAAFASAFANDAVISAAAAPSAINSAAVATVSSTPISTAAAVADVKQSLDPLVSFIVNVGDISVSATNLVIKVKSMPTLSFSARI
jgi:hypothetical protein